MKPQQLGTSSYSKWSVFATCFLVVFVSLGFCSSSKSLFLKSVTAALEIPRSLFSVADSVRYVTTAVVNLFFGTLVAKWGAKKLVAAGIVSLMLSCTISSLADHVAWFYLGGFFLGLGLSWCTTTMMGYVVGAWFREKRGTVMGIILSANGLGAAVATQIYSPLIYDTTVAGGFGYRNAYRVAVAALALILVLVLIFFKESPKSAEKTAVPQKHKKPTRGATWEGMDFDKILHKPYFYITVVCVFFTGACLQAVGNVATAHLEDVGMNTDFIATVVSLHALALTVAKIAAGVSFDRLGLRVTLLVCHAIAVVSVLCLAMVTATSYALASVYEIMISFALPLETILLPLIAADLFGEKCYAKIMGLLVSVNTVGYALGAPLTNLIYDLSGSYKGILLALTGVMAVVLVLFQGVLTAAARERKYLATAE